MRVADAKAIVCCPRRNFVRLNRSRVMRANNALLVAAALLGSAAGWAREGAPPQAGKPPRVFELDGAALAALRERIAAGHVHEPALEALRAEAERALKQPLLSVTEKQQTPP